MRPISKTQKLLAVLAIIVLIAGAGLAAGDYFTTRTSLENAGSRTIMAGLGIYAVVSFLEQRRRAKHE